MCKGLKALLMQAQRGLPSVRTLRLVTNPDQRQPLKVFLISFLYQHSL